MVELPSGTVTLLFSDVEGSTVLLSRLGPAYAEALDGQRQVLRRAWSAHGGTELGTEGDSFFVVFPTAGEAVAAATQAQRELTTYPWPGGERVRVRVGMHTGTPAVHDGGYVGMDVHRAARVAGAAHGGQVVVSSATAELVTGCLPEGVELRDLGRHQLKDIAQAEHIFQLAINGLQADFPPLKTLGAASSLPVPATPLVGREGELADLAALLRTPGVRLVTLTGPGGSGKTRLAIGAAEQLVASFPDGVYFVPMAAVTTTEVMWTTIAEALDVPPEGRIPPGFFSHVAHRSALFVLDNLEQANGADAVVVELLKEAPQAVVIATSRRPLRVAAEYERPVPPLDLPHDDAGVEDVARSGAVRLFVEQARRVRPDFTLSGENTTDVAEICRRLDGLPLAIELAAGRIKLLSPHALLTRLDKALDLKASGVGRPTRQQTLRDTIAWSYDLLTPLQQAVFRRLGVFAGGADLDAIAAGCDDLLDGDDPLDVVGELVDASLATVIEEAQEPRIGMLVTVRAYAHDQLEADGELAAVQRRHANYFCAVAEDMWSLRHGPQQQVAQQRIETELDNLREVLTWAFAGGTGAEPEPERVALGERLCRTFGWVWLGGGYFEEARHWLERCIGLPREVPDLVHVENLARLGHMVSIQGDFIRSRELAEASIDIARGFGDSRELVVGLAVLAVACWDTGDIEGARRAFEEGHAMVRRVADRSLTAVLLTDIAYFESEQGNHDRSQQLIAEVLEICVDIGDTEFATLAELSMITSLFKTGNVAEAHLRSRDAIDPVLTCRDPLLLIGFARSHADILFEAGDLDAAVRLLGSAAVMQERIGLKDPPAAEAQVQGLLLRCQVAMAAVDFQRAFQAGQAIMVEDLLVEMKDH